MRSLDILALFHDRFSCIKITTCLMSFSEPAETDLLPRSRAKAVEPSNNILKQLLLKVLYDVVSDAFELLYISGKS